MRVAGTNQQVVAVAMGDDLDLPCPVDVSNTDGVVFTWTCNDNLASLRSSRIQVTEDGMLRIQSARIGDACNYRCEAADGFGTLSFYVRVNVVDLSSNKSHNKSQQIDTRYSQNPRTQSMIGQRTAQLQRLSVQVDPTNTTVTEGKSFMLNCQIDFQTVSTVENNIDLNVRRQMQPEQREKIIRDSLRNTSPPSIQWLKQYAGQQPVSVEGVHESNLIVIDNIYYYQLAWPRIDNDKSLLGYKRSTLYVRDANQSHSGKYVCLAARHELISARSSETSKKLNYEMAHATVQVTGKNAKYDHTNTTSFWFSFVGTVIIVCFIILSMSMALLSLIAVRFIFRFVQTKYSTNTPSTSTSATFSTSTNPNLTAQINQTRHNPNDNPFKTNQTPQDHVYSELRR